MATVKRYLFTSALVVLIALASVGLVLLIKGCSERIEWNLAD